MRLITTNKLYKAVLLLGSACTLFLSSVVHAQNVAIAHCQGTCPDYSSSLSTSSTSPDLMAILAWLTGSPIN